MHSCRAFSVPSVPLWLNMVFALPHVADALAGDRLRVRRVVENLDRHPAGIAASSAGPGRSAGNRSSPKPGPRRLASLAWKWPVRPAYLRIRSGIGSASDDIAFTSRCRTKFGLIDAVEQFDRLGAGRQEVGFRRRQRFQANAARRGRRSPAGRRRKVSTAKSAACSRVWPGGIRRCCGEPKTIRSPPRSRQQRASSPR